MAVVLELDGKHFDGVVIDKIGSGIWEIWWKFEDPVTKEVTEVSVKLSTAQLEQLKQDLLPHKRTIKKKKS